MIPCEDCVCIAACKYKEYIDLTENCSLVYDLLYHDHGGRQSGFAQSIFHVRRILKPIKWTIRLRYNMPRSIEIVDRKMRRRYVSM